MIWPEHCLIGDPGSTVWPALSAAIHRWERARGRSARYVAKGQNPWTEHFSAIRAEVPDPTDPSTQTSAELVGALARADRVLVAGEARSHCVANTVRDLVEAEPDVVGRLTLLTDATSDVPGFERFGEAFVRDLAARGMALATTGPA
jgi:nicotinamidase-related amidase